MRKILVVGATRGIGYKVVQLGLEEGLSIRAFARSATNIDIQNTNLELIDENALNKLDIEKAVNGCEAVIQTLGVPFNLNMIIGPITLFSESTQILIPAMKKAGLKRLLALTGFWAGDSKKTISPIQRLGFNAIFGRAYADKSIQESLIKSSGLEWTIVRPGILTNSDQVRGFRVLEDPKSWRNGIVSRLNGYVNYPAL